MELDEGAIHLNRTTYIEALRVAGSGRIVIPEVDDRYTTVTFHTRSGWVRLDVDRVKDRVDMVSLELTHPVAVSILVQEYGLSGEPVREERPNGTIISWEPPGITFILDPEGHETESEFVTHLAFHQVD
ncbi:MAG: hypothetical protein HY340_03260 [Candidatus Kerfeldbacteria bacterium]|nr:hypothetical protein [Candidatus Kerfeldbacteria bacterium]